MRKLRQKLQRNSGSWRYIHTHFGIGYRFDPEPLGSEPTGALSVGEDALIAVGEERPTPEVAPAATPD